MARRRLEISLEDTFEISREKQSFQLFFLKDRHEQNVEIIELESINFDYVKRRLDNGESVFITPSSKQGASESKTRPNDVFFNIEVAKSVSKRNSARLWYFKHS